MNSFWKNKKVVAYIALKHHNRFIIPIMDEISRQGGETIYIVGQAERSQEITAVEAGLNYYHIFEFLTPEDKYEIHKTYQTLKNGFAEALLKDTVFNMQVPTVLDKTLYATAQEHTGFSNFMDKYAPHLCIALHEINRWGKMFTYHAKKRNIPCITFQEGQINIRTFEKMYGRTGHVQNSTLNLVWGEGSRNALSTYEAPKERIIATGNTHIDKEIDRLKKEHIRTKKRKAYKCLHSYVVCVFISGKLPEINEMLPLLDLFKTETQKKLFIKFHPNATKFGIDKWISQIDENVRNSIVFIHGEESTYNLIEIADLVVISQASTIGIESLALGKPLATLSFESKPHGRSTLPEKDIAIEYTPADLAQAIMNNTDFHSMINSENVSQHIKEELTDPENSIDNTIAVLKACITANTQPYPAPLNSKIKADKQWSIILPVVDAPETLLSILEKVSIYSESQDFEVIMIKPQHLSKETEYILDTLEGDISFLNHNENEGLQEAMNQAAMSAAGRFLIFLSPHLAPEEGWLVEIQNHLKQYGQKKIFGGRVINPYGNIVHAGIVVDSNHAPRPAYAHLDKNFPPANKTRSFQMVDYFITVQKDFFLDLGGFDKNAGDYSFMDISLRAREKTSDPQAVIYIPKVLLSRLNTDNKEADIDDSIFFHSRWHGRLWDNEDELYKKDGISQLQLHAARMTRAMETALKK